MRNINTFGLVNVFRKVSSCNNRVGSDCCKKTFSLLPSEMTTIMHGVATIVSEWYDLYYNIVIIQLTELMFVYRRSGVE